MLRRYSHYRTLPLRRQSSSRRSTIGRRLTQSPRYPATCRRLTIGRQLSTNLRPSPNPLYSGSLQLPLRHRCWRSRPWKTCRLTLTRLHCRNPGCYCLQRYSYHRRCWTVARCRLQRCSPKRQRRRCKVHVSLKILLVDKPFNVTPVRTGPNYTRSSPICSIPPGGFRPAVTSSLRPVVPWASLQKSAWRRCR